MNYEIYSQLIKFLEDSKFNKEKNFSSHFVSYRNFYYYDLLSENELIYTTANDVPRLDGRWDYNGHNTYDYYYIFLESNKLLVIEVAHNIRDYSDDPYWITFTLHSDADQFVIQSKKYLNFDPFINIVSQDGRLINTYWFEKLRRRTVTPDNLPLKEFVQPISIDELLKRLHEKNDTFERIRSI